MSVITKKKPTKTKQSNKESLKEDMISFIKNNITKPENNNIIVVKALWNRYFRVNFIKSEYLAEDSIIHNNTIVDSRFIEIIDVGKTHKIIDKTIRKQQII